MLLKSASDFKGSVVGETEQLTKGILEMAQGKVLVIDEAYNLWSGGGGGASGSDGSGGASAANYGALALDTLVEKVQTGGDIAVILIGYKRQMMEMLDNANPGLRSRFDPASALEFEDYSDRELTQILTRAARRMKVHSAFRCTSCVYCRQPSTTMSNSARKHARTHARTCSRSSCKQTLAQTSVASYTISWRVQHACCAGFHCS